MKAGNGSTRTETQFSVFLASKPNILARVCQQLANDKINIVALSMMDATEHGVLRLVAADSAAARQSLARINVPTAESTVLLTTLPNRPGALADVVERLASEHIAVSYAYLTTGAPGGRTLGVFRVSDFKRAAQVLDERKPRRKAAATARTGPRPRRT